jgi:hypothetical protein
LAANQGQLAAGIETRLKLYSVESPYRLPK